MIYLFLCICNDQVVSGYSHIQDSRANVCLLFCVYKALKARRIKALYEIFTSTSVVCVIDMV